MRLSFLAMVLFIMLYALELYPIDIKVTDQPSCFYSLDGESFTGADSSLYPEYYDGKRISSCKGIRCEDTGTVVMWLSDNDVESRYRFKVFATDTCKELAIQFKKIYQTGTTVSLANIIIFPTRCK